MIIKTVCRSCLGSGTRVDVIAHTSTRHPTTGHALATHTCPDCVGTGHHHLAATTHPAPTGNGI